MPFQRQPRTVRIAFIGASTTVGNHFYPYSYPEFIGNWLNLWSDQRKLDVRFEVLNAGRESITSSDNVNIVREEVLPLKPDLLVYYEGANQFQLGSMVPGQPSGSASRLSLAEAESCPARPARSQPAPSQPAPSQRHSPHSRRRPSRHPLRRPPLSRRQLS